MLKVNVLLAIFFISGACVAHAGENADSDALVVPLHDATRPPTIHIHTMSGGITVRGQDRKDIAIETHGRKREESRDEERSEGMHRLDLNGQNGIDVREENNVVTIKTDIFNQHGSDIVVDVPRHSSLQLKTMTGGDINVEDVTGDIEAENLNGAILLRDVGGSAIAHSMNGAVVAEMKSVDSTKPMSFSTMNGKIDVTLPPDVKARVSMKTDNGEILSDFDVKLEAPTTTSSGGGRQSDGSYHIHLDKTLHGTINGGGPEYQFRSFNGKIYIRKAK